MKHPANKNGFGPFSLSYNEARAIQDRLGAVGVCNGKAGVMPKEKMSFRKKVDRVHQLPVHLDRDCMMAVMEQAVKGPSATEVIRSCVRFALIKHKKEYLEYVIEEAEKTIKSIIEKQGKEKGK